MKKFKLSQVDLKNVNCRAEISRKLREFEASFSYPLGEKKFEISHGNGEGFDYFSFFEQMGEVYYFVAQNQDKVVGAGCAILRNGPEGKFWYLCDLKVSKEYRGHGVMEAMYKKYLLKCSLRSRKMVTVNMGKGVATKNALLKKTQSLLFMFSLKAETLNFHTWKKDELPQDLKFFTTNNGKKDLIINGSRKRLFHVHNTPLSGFTECSLEDISDDDEVMTCLKADGDNYDEKSLSGKGLLISVGLKNPQIYTVEI